MSRHDATQACNLVAKSNFLPLQGVSTHHVAHAAGAADAHRTVHLAATQR